MSKRTVEIHKANIPLLDGESLDMFERSLRAELQKSFGTRGSANKPGTYIWPRAVFSDRAVIEKSSPDLAGDNPHRLLSVTYKRADDGGFEFGDPTPVREQVNFIPVSKAKEEDPPETLEVDVDKAFWDGLPL